MQEDQYYLGRCVILLKRHLEDFFDINENELKELFKITKNLRDVVKKVFGADMFNYATLGNVERHVHLHFIPRYSKKVVFKGIAFEDKNWGKNYAPYNKNFKIPKNVLMKIKDTIKSASEIL
ncbi:MAG: HIT family protein [Patescibacteria group bacterium]|nr:HIT family protein [Patescibacteria group bacterium]